MFYKPCMDVLTFRLIELNEKEMGMGMGMDGEQNNDFFHKYQEIIKSY